MNHKGRGRCVHERGVSTLISAKDDCLMEWSLPRRRRSPKCPCGFLGWCARCHDITFNHPGLPVKTNGPLSPPSLLKMPVPVVYAEQDRLDIFHLIVQPESSHNEGVTTCTRQQFL
uniref:Uncharacterized protein n=2 Tax=Caenorhabditis tropicalis TaxID=1561998 RepID=A0A1I7THK9_9PELO